MSKFRINECPFDIGQEVQCTEGPLKGTAFVIVEAPCGAKAIQRCDTGEIITPDWRNFTFIGLTPRLPRLLN